MKKNKSDIIKAADEKKENTQSIIKLLPILIILAIVPLIVFLKVVKLTGARHDFWTGEPRNWDFFSYYKVIWIYVLTVISLGSSYFVKRIKKSNFYIPLLAYGILISLSSMVSKYKIISLYGFVDRYEGAFVLICYLFLTFITFNLIKNKFDIKLIFFALGIGAFIMSLIGIFQFFGMDIFRTYQGKLWILPPDWEKLADSLKFTFAPGTIYATLYNTNYVGSYMSMLFLLSIIAVIYTKNKVKLSIIIIFNLLMYSNWIGCRSRAGMVGGTAGLILLIIIFRKKLLKKWMLILGLVVSYIVIALLMNLYTIKAEYSSGPLLAKIASLGSAAKQVVEGSNVALKDIVMKKNRIEIRTKKETFIMEIDKEKIKFYDTINNVLEYKIIKDENKDKVIIFKNEKYSKYKVKLSENNIFTLYFNGMKLNFIYMKNGFKLINSKGKLDTFHNIDRIKFFDGKEKAGSMRFYIWSRSIPLLKKTLFLGFGPDTFAIYFPQNDYIGKLKAFGTIYEVVDKPHDMYLQIAINTGVLSLIAFLVLVIGYIYQSLNIYLKRNLNEFEIISGGAIAVAIFAYLVTATFNDSLVSVAPVFWVLLGAGLGINRLNEEKKQKLEDE
ncbi:O-antigen ligase family protein [Haliovirga abyssi]|uniref:Polymerase n=1 Tax=Haliovirga abyssi TaxID=2996794 RepID=A0AAU9DSQ9_9FUSO|nr:O-antigen ligase family protein [Haliovirga abyssi]BDU50094.1 polymerase [Haliovirga abyssi]